MLQISHDRICFPTRDNQALCEKGDEETGASVAGERRGSKRGLDIMILVACECDQDVHEDLMIEDHR